MKTHTPSPPARILLTDDRCMLVDAKDVQELAAYRWYPVPARRSLYAAATIGGRRVLAHRLIAGARDMYDPIARKWKAADTVDHVNGDGLDNRRRNLRIATRAENQRNTRGRPGRRASRFKGVSFCSGKSSRQWRATIDLKGRQLHLGYHATEESAALAYNDAAAVHFGQFAFLNVIDHVPVDVLHR